MRHLLLPAALLIAAQPVLADVGKPNGATVLAGLLVLAWGVICVTRPAKR